MPRGTLVESLKDGGVQYYFNGASQMVMGWITWNADGSKTFFDLVTGVAKSGFYTDSEGDTYYFDPAADNHTVRWTHYISGNRYYFNGNGVMQKGLIRWNSTGDYSFFGENGAAASGLTAVGDVTYCFNPDTFTSLRWSQTINGKLYYFDSDYTMVTGWVKWNGENASSYFGEDGAAYSGWHDIDESRYYFDPAKNFRNVKWTQYIEGSRYYFDGNARMVTGWIQWNSGDGKGLYSYFATPDGAMVYGEQVIDGVSYDFGTTGYVDRDDLRIMGASRTTAAQMARYYIQSVGSSTYPSDVYAQYGAKNINEFTQIVFEEAEAEGVRAEVLFAQVVHETGYLKFGGDVSADQCNFGGLGATGGGNPGIDFVELSIDRGYGKQNAVRIGLRAQTQHLKAYGSTDDLNQEKVDDRFGYVSPRGKAPTVMELGGTWAADKGYGEALAKIIQDILEA